MTPRLAHDHYNLLEENARLRKECLKLSRGTQFTSDSDKYPTQVIFQNGRRVELASTKGCYYLVVGWDSGYSDAKTQRDGRTGNWISTCEGTRLYPFDLRHEDVDIGWIARSLSNTCRFLGHLKKYYSTSEHCVRGSYLVPRKFAQHFLLHDAGEAITHDLTRPFKYEPEFKFYRELEHKNERIIFERYGLDPEMPPEVKHVDNRLVATEARDLQYAMDPEWGRSINSEGKLERPNPYPFHIHPWSPRLAYRKFLKRFRELFPHEPVPTLGWRDRILGILDGVRGF